MKVQATSAALTGVPFTRGLRYSQTSGVLRVLDTAAGDACQVQGDCDPMEPGRDPGPAGGAGPRPADWANWAGRPRRPRGTSATRCGPWWHRSSQGAPSTSPPFTGRTSRAQAGSSGSPPPPVTPLWGSTRTGPPVRTRSRAGSVAPGGRCRQPFRTRQSLRARQRPILGRLQEQLDQGPRSLQPGRRLLTSRPPR